MNEHLKPAGLSANVKRAEKAMIGNLWFKRAEVDPGLTSFTRILRPECQSSSVGMRHAITAMHY
jgi:hypothetical protein